MVMNFFKKKLRFDNFEKKDISDSEDIDYSKVQIIEKSCPICKSDVKGNDIYLFYCKKCNILFKKEELFLDNPERLKLIIKKKIVKNYIKDKDAFLIEEKKLPYKKTSLETKKHIALNDEKTSIKIKNHKYYVSSKNSKILHESNCNFVKNINKNNKLLFKSVEEAMNNKNYKLCKCIY
ncbi:MAG: hypothetical protein QXK76_02125 [Candidatus Woesearchaeota archaeon]